ncbi:Glycosyltransferase involved in cell wall bisynthesis [Nocardioides terrae]|uniref:Glycosyltransferase involved in cell wall bisynthesis n=1 Tax=Nocardioides terrae TaxID=574651 RepID=A0A1I1EQD5_9ACTN|nr:glycosyltransferase [Nocardioides terrae]SFB87718.1 Glycosyltransferase involved in cell wall bisynthesis [Nocardioides terrae]
MPPDRDLVAFVSLSTELYGAELSLLSLCKGMPASIVAPMGPLLEHATAAGLDTREIVEAEILALKKIGQSRSPLEVGQAIWRGSQRLRAMAIWDKRAVISFSQWLNPALALAAFGKSTPLVLDMHDGPFSGPGRLVQRASVKLADRSIFVSQSNGRAVIGSERPSKHPVVHRPIEVPQSLVAAKATTAPQGPLRVIYVGRLDPEKRVHLLLQSAERVGFDHLSVTVVGESTATENMSATMAALHPKGSFLGSVGRHVALEHMSRSDVLVTPAQGEAFGRTVFEAALLGIPAVVDSSAAAAELIVDGVSGWVLGGKTPWTRLDDLLRTLAAEPQTVARVGSEARRRLGSLVDPDYVRAQYWAELPGNVEAVRA